MCRNRKFAGFCTQSTPILLKVRSTNVNACELEIIKNDIETFEFEIAL